MNIKHNTLIRAIVSTVLFLLISCNEKSNNTDKERNLHYSISLLDTNSVNLFLETKNASFITDFEAVEILENNPFITSLVSEDIKLYIVRYPNRKKPYFSIHLGEIYENRFNKIHTFEVDAVSKNAFFIPPLFSKNYKKGIKIPLESWEPNDPDNL